MKETKVYVDELPKSCYICPCYDTSEGFCSMTGSYIKYKKGRILQDCQLIDIKDHDRELVNKVCEKIKEQLGFIVDGQERISCDGSVTGDKTILAVLNQIQKEFEK